MCGIAGIVACADTDLDLLQYASMMSRYIARRGPDSHGIWTSPDHKIAIGHRRLAIQGLGTQGNQPMKSKSGRYVIVYNGEVYNHRNIRSELDSKKYKYEWRGSSDTETLLAAIEEWGIARALRKMSGMWAFALVDTHKNTLHLVRDRVGEKPLYWGYVDEYKSFIFTSDLAAVKAFQGISPRINKQAMRYYLKYGYVPAPHSIYSNIYKLEAGHMLTASLPMSQSKDITVEAWWALKDLEEERDVHGITSTDDAVRTLGDCLSSVVSEYANADVPIGVFLSSGVDSTLLTALLQEQSKRPIDTFTISFDQNGFDEAPAAMDIARYLGTNHSQINCASKDLLDLVALIPSVYSEPFADSSQLPTMLVCQSAVDAGLKVALGGDGADELFGGYQRYMWTLSIWSKLALMPSSVRRSIGPCASVLPSYVLNRLGGTVGVKNLSQKMDKISDMLSKSKSLEDFYHSLLAHYPDVSHSELRGFPVNRFCDYWDSMPESWGEDILSRMMRSDMASYLPDDLLVKVDRAAMWSGLETRAPFLDHRIITLASQMSSEIKLDGKTNKVILRRLLARYVPSSLTNRPKSGFSVPLASWLRGPLRKWADELLDPVAIRKSGYIDEVRVRDLWSQHLLGNADNSAVLWPVLVWQQWSHQWL